MLWNRIDLAVLDPRLVSYLTIGNWSRKSINLHQTNILFCTRLLSAVKFFGLDVTPKKLGGAVGW
jgi:hypothetical protein